jgi:beta-mannosidase
MTDLLHSVDWQVFAATAGSVQRPDQLPDDGDWLPAPVPGTAAAAARLAGRTCSAAELDGKDWWWRTTVDTRHDTEELLLVVNGLATVADVWVAGEHVLHSENMFRSYTVRLHDLPAESDLIIRCAALSPLVGRRRPRPRWKAPLVDDQSWRWLRTSLLGRAPAWSGSVPPVGPWRSLSMTPLDGPVVVRKRIRALVDGADGKVRVRLQLATRAPIRHASVRVGTTTVEATITGDVLHADVHVPDVRLWWPHTHGRPERYRAVAEIDGHLIGLADIGFRALTADRSTGGFTLRINGVPVFARGACWMPIDPVSLHSSPEQLRLTIRAARDAGFNLIRLPGGTIYESDAFYDICSELGLLVWQDIMLASLDPPDDPAFHTELTAEVEDLLDRTAHHPCLAVICGGNETEQQPVLMGIGESIPAIRAINDVIPAALASAGANVTYVTSSPSGGRFATDLAAGVSHYFGVGAYLRPLSDVRSAGVRFAAECLAFSIPPEPQAVEREFGSARVAGHHPLWKQGVPRDRSASWDLEDVRDHYVARFFGVDPMLVRRDDPDRYLDMGRAAVCIAMEEVFTQWRRPGSACSGGLVWTMRDLRPGAGSGLFSHTGEPKAPWYVLRRVLAGLAVLSSDDGLDGRTIVVLNDGPADLIGRLEVTLWSEHGTVLESGRTEIAVPAHDGVELRLDAVIGSFTDAGHAYRFGPRVRDALSVCLRNMDGSIVAECVALLGEHLRPVHTDGLHGVVRQGPDGWTVEITATRIAQWVVASSEQCRVSKSWFHMVPGMTRRILLTPDETIEKPPTVRMRALNIVESTAHTWKE